jgi:hypothetical protein
MVVEAGRKQNLGTRRSLEHLDYVGGYWIMLEYFGACRILFAMIPMYVIIGNPLF